MRPAIAILVLISLLAFTAEFWSFAIAATAQLIFGGGVEGFPSPSVF